VRLGDSSVAEKISEYLKKLYLLYLVCYPQTGYSSGTLTLKNLPVSGSWNKPILTPFLPAGASCHTLTGTSSNSLPEGVFTLTFPVQGIFLTNSKYKLQDLYIFAMLTYRDLYTLFLLFLF
jgi:hypothetical protein